MTTIKPSTLLSGSTRRPLVFLDRRADDVNASTQAISTVVDRTEGWLQGMDKAGIAVRPEWLAFTDQDHETAERAAIGMLSQPDRPTAIVAGNSEVALAIIAACRHLAIPLPQGLSLICFDDPNWASLITPALSVVSRPVHELGSQAVNLLLTQIRGEQENPDSLVLPSEIIIRDSITAPPA